MLEKKNYKIKSVDLFEQPPTKKKKKKVQVHMYICVQLHAVLQHLLSTISADAPSGAEEFSSEATHV